MQNERVTYLTNAEQKAELEAFAKARGESVGSVLREAAARYIAQPSQRQEAELAALVEQVNEAVPAMEKSLDRMSARLQQTHSKVDQVLRDAGIRR